MAKPIPDGFTSVTPHLIIKGCDKALDFYEKAFGAEILARSPGPDGRMWHAEMRIGDAIIMMADEFPEMSKTSRAPSTAGATTVVIHIYCADTDALFDRAVKAGATVAMPPMDMFCDRYSQVTIRSATPAIARTRRPHAGGAEARQEACGMETRRRKVRASLSRANRKIGTMRRER